MENEIKIKKDEKSFPSKSNKSQKPNKTHFSSKYKKKSNLVNKSFSKSNNKFLNKKRKEKNKNMVVPETPHNTGQYLSHIHQGLDPKKKSNVINKEKDKDDKKENNLENNNKINLFEDDEENLDDFGNMNFDFEFINDKNRDKLMSMEGKNLSDFLFKSKEKGNNGNNNFVKSIFFNENKDKDKDKDNDNDNDNDND